MPLPEQSVPSRGWGEDFWVQISQRQGDWLEGVVDNPLVESRLHQLRQHDRIIFHIDHVLAIHSVHRQELVLHMDEEELHDLAQWLREKM